MVDARGYFQRVRDAVRRRDSLEMRIREQQAARDGVKAVAYADKVDAGGARVDGIGEIVARYDEDLDRLITQEVECSALLAQAQGVVDKMRRGLVDGVCGCSSVAVDVLEMYYVEGRTTASTARILGYSKSTIDHERLRGLEASQAFMPIVSE